MWGKQNRQSGGNRDKERRIDRRTVLKSIGVMGTTAGGASAFTDRVRGERLRSNASAAFVRDVGKLAALPNTVTIRASDQQAVQYTFTVSGRAERGSNTDSGDVVSGNVVAGTVAQRDADSFGFSGQITSFAMAGGPATVAVNGTEVDNPVGLPESDGDGADSTQETDCVPIRPIRSDAPVTEFYGYEPDVDEPNSQRSNTGLEGDGVSRLLLYEGPSGTSLVMFHGGGENDQGGAATFEITGLPAAGEWVVLDDDYEGSRDEFQISETSAVLNWAWGVEGRSDGAVFRGLGDAFEIRIDPAFNEDARLEPFGPGRIEHWELLSATGDGFTAYRFPLDRPLVLGTETC